MKLSSPFAALPVLAGAALGGGGVVAVVIDLFEQISEQRNRSDGRAPEPVLIRNLSYIVGNPKSLKAWVFLIGCILYAAFGGATGGLQADVLSDHNAALALADNASASKAKGALLIVYPIIIGLCGALLVLGVRWMPYGTYPKAGIAFHVLMAGCFQMFSIIYCFEAATLATDMFGADASITVTRKVFAYISAAGLGVSFLFGGYVMGRTAQLYQHERKVKLLSSGSQDVDQSARANASASANANANANPGFDQQTSLEGSGMSRPSGILTAKEVWSIRKLMAGLAVVQLSIGIAVSAVTITGAAEVDLY